jgi:Ca-activated chloride channel family protein
MFGSILKQSKFTKDIKFDDIQGLAVTAASSSNLLQMQFIELVQKAKKIYSAKKKRRGME